MAALIALYQKDPYWIWLAIGCVFLAVNLTLGAGRLIWPVAAAVAIALIEAVGLRMGPLVEVPLFLALCAAAYGALFVIANRGSGGGSPAAGAGPAQYQAPTQYLTPAEKKAAANAVRQPAKPVQTEAERAERNARLIGRIGKTTSEFVNGVGRVFIDGAEWGAELGRSGNLPAGSPVRIVRVIGGIRLQVESLHS